MRRIRRVGRLEKFKINNSIVGTIVAQSVYVTPFATRLNSRGPTDQSEFT